MKKNSIIAILLAVFTVLFLSDFKILETIYLMPNIFWLLPLFGFYFLSVWYFSKAFASDYKIWQRIVVVFIGSLFAYLLLYAGFNIWKMSNGNIFSDSQEFFQINIKNVFFWVVYQSYLILFFFSSFKQLVTIK